MSSEGAVVRALLLTDVVGSTDLAERIGDQATAAVWTAHDRAARDLLPLFGGVEIDKTDGMLLLFDNTKQALGYAIEYHRRLAAMPVPLRARAGLHIGPVLLRKNIAEDIARGAKPLELDGLAKPVAARTMSLARGGQTLLTAEARATLGDTTLWVNSIGHWVMKGVSEPIELFAAAEAADARLDPPPESEKVHRVVRVGERWLPVAEIPNNLPQQVNAFLGRERELAEVKAMLQQARLVTLLGMGGLGKTRLSLQVAAELMADFPDGVWFLDLAPINDPMLMVGEAAQVLEVREEPGRPLLQTVCAHLKPRRVLLILDNCEHLVKACAEFSNAVLRAASKVRILSSSRERLHVAGEQACPILPLPVPQSGDGLEALARLTAVRLFVQRAQEHKPAFSLNEREAPAIAELVARLEGIPLAIELAAARVRSLSVSDINTRLKDRYKLLTGGGRVLMERQQTLRALVDWSYDLLDANEQTVLARLSIFAGGFDLEAAEVVCGSDPLAAEDVLDILASLVEKSLVMLDERESRARYQMLETIRDYACEKLIGGSDLSATAARHSEHYLAVAKAANQGLTGPDQAEWIWRTEAELDNLRAAITLSLAGGVDRIVAVKFAVALQGFWILRGYTTEGRNTVRAALALPEIQASDRAHAHALYVGAALAESQSDYDQARQMLETCLALRRGLGDEFDIAATLSTLTMARLPAGDAEGARQSELEALQIFRRLQERVGEAIGLLHLGQVEAFVGDDERARDWLEQGLALSRSIRHQEVEGECELALGEIALDADDLLQARARFLRSLNVCREAGDKRGEARALGWLGKTDLREGDQSAAGPRLDDALRALRDFVMREDLLNCAEDHVRLAAAEERMDDAIALASAVEQARQRMALVRRQHSQSQWLALLTLLRQRAGATSSDAAWALGSQWEIDEMTQRALARSVHGRATDREGAAVVA
jgi:predicted ATPase/class 3 adenylate cyclase